MLKLLSSLANNLHIHTHTLTTFSGLARLGGGATGMVVVPRVTVVPAETGGVSTAGERETDIPTMRYCTKIECAL